MNVWPAIATATVSVVGALGLILAVLAHFRWNDQKIWQQSAEASTALVNSLKGRLEEALKEVGEAKAEREMLKLRIDTLEKTVAYVERQNHILQIQLDDSEKRNAEQHHTHRQKPEPG